MINWIYQNGSLVQFFMQIIFWVGILVCAIVAVIKFAKLVDAKISADNALIAMYQSDDECGCEHDHEAKDDDVSVEKFVD